MSVILVGTDTSVRAEAAVDEAARLARAEGAELVVLYVRPPLAAREVFDAKKPADPERYLADLRVRFPGTRTRSEEGDAADRIVEVARQEGADLIVVGNRGLDERQRRAFLRSVPARVANRAPCSVYVVDSRRAA